MAVLTFASVSDTSAGSGNFHLDYSLTDNGSSVTLSGTFYLYYGSRGKYGLSASTHNARVLHGSDVWKDSSIDNNSNPGTNLNVGTVSRTFGKTHAQQTITLDGRGVLQMVASSPRYNKSKILGAVSFTIPALASYTIAYNANGGSGAPANQTKWYGEALTLSSTVPTRTGYVFRGWNTAQDGSGTSYSAGASYTANTAAILYAQWECANKVTVYDENGVAHTGIVTVYDANGNAHNCLISVYDSNGNKHGIQ